MRRVWGHLEEILLVFFLGIMVVVMGLQIMFHHVFSNSLTWSEELVRYLFIWSTFISIPFCCKRKLSIRIRVFSEEKYPKIEKAVNIILLIFFFFLFASCYKILSYSIWSKQASPALQISMFWIHLAPAVGFFLTIIRLWEKITGKEKSC